MVWVGPQVPPHISGHWRHNRQPLRDRRWLTTVRETRLRALRSHGISAHSALSGLPEIRGCCHRDSHNAFPNLAAAQ